MNQIEIGSLPFALFAVLPIHQRLLQFFPFVPIDFPYAATISRFQDASFRSYNKINRLILVFFLHFYKNLIRIHTVGNHQAYLLVVIFVVKHFAMSHPSVLVIDLLKEKKNNGFRK